MIREGSFQSLEGIFGFFNLGEKEKVLRYCENVSIPRRDFWVFQLVLPSPIKASGSSFVSIPRRDFWVFQRDLPWDNKSGLSANVSIPRRDFWVFQQDYHQGSGTRSGFQSLEGIFGFFNKIRSHITPQNR
ncbi:hypothetical protein CKA32_000661 [Geitlerinema sp. FC II]|nr:hypothetical protein CKA32_000661 [Geitlerinema sp. FC II]